MRDGTKLDSVMMYLQRQNSEFTFKVCDRIKYLRWTTSQ